MVAGYLHERLCKADYGLNVPVLTQFLLQHLINYCTLEFYLADKVFL